MKEFAFGIGLSIILLACAGLSLVTGYAGLIGCVLGVIGTWLPSPVKLWLGDKVAENIE